MSVWGVDPAIYEINTVAWLHDLAVPAGRPMTLAAVPDEEWDRVALPGVDAVWLMGVWERSPEGVRLALSSPTHVAEFHATLDDFTAADVIGSAYSIRRYEVDERLGGRAGLMAARAELAVRGVKLLVDFVPNHVAPDHPWLSTHPEYFIRGDAADLAAAPDEFLAVGDSVIARGRDPYFPPWPDVAQLDAFAPGLRGAAVDTLIEIGDVADGVRCDMAMLMLNDVFQRTWGERAGTPPATEYWSDVITAARARHPELLFMAEAYWDLEARLQDLGFDYCYDKRLYDRLLHDGAGDVRAHLGADIGYQRRLVRFVENHDEPRVASELPAAAERAAAVVIATLPGATLWHEGQFEGWRTHVPVLLGRRPSERVDEERRSFHHHLVAVAHDLRGGEWTLCAVSGWPDNATCEQLLAWCWTDGEKRTLVVVNDADAPATAMVHVPWTDLAGRTWRLDDLLGAASYERSGDDVVASGLYVGLDARAFHVLRWTPRED